MLQLPSITAAAAIEHLQRLGRVQQVAVTLDVRDEAARLHLTAGVWWPGGRERLFDHFADHLDRYRNPWGMLLKTCVRSPMNGQAIGGWVATVREPLPHGLRVTFRNVCPGCGLIPPPPGIRAMADRLKCSLCKAL